MNGEVIAPKKLVYMCKRKCAILMDIFVTPYGPRIQHDAFPLNGKTHFLFIYLFGENMIFFLKDLELPLIFVLFLKGKQNKKENPKCDSLFGKDGLRKTKSVQKSGYLLGRYDEKTVAPF